MGMSTTIGRASDARIIELDGDNTIFSITFTEDEKHILCGSQDGVLWIDHDARVARMTLEAGSPVYAVVVSKDGHWIVTGGLGRMVVWDARTHKKVHEMKEHNRKQCVSAIDVSNDSTKVVSGSDDKTVHIFSITSGQRLIDPILHENYVIGVKFSPSGEQIATATVNGGVRVFNVYTGVQLCDIPISVNRNPSTPLAWSTDGRKLFVVCPGRVVCLGSSPEGPLISRHSEWAIQNSNSPVSIVNSGSFITCSAGSSISFWDPNSQKQLGHPILHSAVVRCLAVSSDGRHLACGTKDQKIMVHDLRETLGKSCFTVELPLMHMSEAVVQSWIQDNPANTEVELSEEITLHPSYHAFANRALIRARLKQWNAAIDDATKSLKIKPSPIGHIAHALALVGQDKREAALWAFDLVFRDCDPNENKLLLLIKSILLYVSGKHDDAISRVRDLIPPEHDDTAYCCIQVLATMYLNMAYYEHAIQSFQHAHLLAPPDKSRYPMTISLIFGEPFDLTGISAVRRACETLCAAGYTKEAAEMFLRTANILGEETRTSQTTTNWLTEFAYNCALACEHNGDAAFKSAKSNEAISQYTAALSLDPSRIVNLLIKRSRVQTATGWWDDALRDADKAIEMDPLCPWGYEEKHAALYGAQRYDEAIGAYSDFLSAIENSHDAEIRQLRQTYMSPAQTMAVIDEEVGKVPTTSPFVLIDVTSGRLCHKTERFHVFRQSQTFKRLVSSVRRMSDHEQIVQAVARYFGYAMLSHTWDGEEPSYQDVNSVGSVWDLDASACPMKTKLRRFCEEVRKLGYFWAWSDTCCIDKTSSELVINQSLTLMFHWYENSLVTLVLLANVEPGVGALTRSRWIIRSWTLQELLAPKVVRFYDCNWNPYLEDTRANHKQPGAIMEELSSLMGISPGTIITFHPDHLTVREKLRLASTRHAREVEDEAYSLFGIFQSDIRPKYGERKAALGNLLQEIVANSEDITVLAWNGISSSFNSCLPLSLSVYSQPPHTTEIITPEEMAKRVTALRTRVRKDQVLVIYDQIIRLPPVRFGNRRLHLPCVVFPVNALDRFHENPQVYRANVSGLGEVEFMTADSLPLDHPQNLVFVHPWIREIRGPYSNAHQGWGHGLELTADSSTGMSMDEGMDIDSEGGSSMALHQVPSTPFHKYTQALQLIAYLGQSFNALVLVRQPDGHFKRVAAENKIIASGLTCHIASLRDIYAQVLDIL